METNRKTTVMFATFVGAAKVVEAAGESAAQDAIGRCIERLGGAAISCGGRVAKTMHDKAMVLVATPDAAADAAVAMHTAIERLDGPEPVRASALETLDTAGDTKLIGPLLSLWELVASAPGNGEAWLAQALQDEDDLVQRCAALIRARREGDTMTHAPTAISTIERVLILRGVPLFADLSPADLEEVARIMDCPVGTVKSRIFRAKERLRVLLKDYRGPDRI